MTDIRELGGRGKAVFDTAQRLQGAGLIDNAQFKELTNSKVGPQDVKIADAALQKLNADTPDAMALVRAIPRLSNDILGLQAKGLARTLTGAATPGDKPRSFMDNIGDALSGALKSMSGVLDGSYAREAIRNIK